MKLATLRTTDSKYNNWNYFKKNLQEAKNVLCLILIE